MKDSTKDQVEGKAHEVKGAVKETIGHAVKNPSRGFGTTVRLNEYACALEGIAHDVASRMGKSRCTFASREGPPNGPDGLRVSATRQGVSG